MNNQRYPTAVSLKDAANLVATCGATNTFIFEGEPGIGKSAMLKMLGDQLNMPTRYIDCALFDLGDLQMPMVEDGSNEENSDSNEESKKCVAFVPNKMFMADEPIIVMLDELGKASRPVMNGFLPLMYEHRIGQYHLPEGSIVFAATNLSTDGVGDFLQAHAKNRTTYLRINKPKAGFNHDGSVEPHSWAEWALDNDIDASVMAWVREYPHCMASYTDYEAGEKVDNPYIFVPTESQSAFVTPRSLAHASHIVKQRHNMTDDVLIAALSGTIGKEAASDMQAFLSVADALPPFKVIIEKPDTADIPSNPIAAVILALGAVTRLDNSNVNGWVRYMRRLPREVQFMFTQSAMRSKKAGLLAHASEFTKWARENSWAV